MASVFAPPLLILVFLQKSNSPGVAGLGWSRIHLGGSDSHSPSSVISQQTQGIEDRV